MYANATKQRRTRVGSLAEKLYRERHTYLLHIAVKHAASQADAEEAVNDAFAAFIRAFNPDSEAPPLAWLTLTLKRECWGKRRRRNLDRSADYVAVPDAGDAGCYLSSIPSRATTTEQLISDVNEARVALAALKPAERRAIGLIAAGYSYLEVGEITGWTYTKVNRCATEGRATLRRGRLKAATVPSVSALTARLRQTATGVSPQLSAAVIGLAQLARDISARRVCTAGVDLRESALAPGQRTLD